MNIIESKNIIQIIRKTLQLVDPRLTHHGERVSYIVSKMLQADGTFTSKEISLFSLLCIIHDIGISKTEEIDQLSDFHAEDSWDHSIHGYLFLRNLPVLAQYADIILYHHLAYEKLQTIPFPFKKVTAYLHLADKVDFMMQKGTFPVTESFLCHYRDTKFGAGDIDLFLKANEKYSILRNLRMNHYEQDLQQISNGVTYTQEEIIDFIQMLVFAIDFRSEYTVTHTITTVAISMQLAKLLHLSKEDTQMILCGALLHDLGKVSIPVEILEKPSFLSETEMEIMKQHVILTGEIIKDFIHPAIYEIAVSHHEKVDGTGYPRGLKGSEISINSRIVAVSDVVSALNGKRSYKEPFDRSNILRVLHTMWMEQKICPLVTKIILDHYDELIPVALEQCRPTVETYSSMKQEFKRLKAYLKETFGE